MMAPTVLPTVPLGPGPRRNHHPRGRARLTHAAPRPSDQTPTARSVGRSVGAGLVNLQALPVAVDMTVGGRGAPPRRGRAHARGPLATALGMCALPTPRRTW
jgi:hypothetical protein